MDAGASPENAHRNLKVRCCIVGGGPAGMMLGYLFGRAGIEVVVLEKHADFFRDFRGDTVHPSTLQVMDELGLIDGFLKLPHQRLQQMDGLFGGTSVRIADLGRLRVKHPFIAFVPQWDFLNFLRESGAKFPSLKVMMNAEAVDLIRRGDAISGVRAKTPEGMIDIEADLTVACDGRHSLVREKAGLEVEEIGAPMDVLWFRAGKAPDESERLFARVDPGRMMVTFDRGDYWQCAYIIAKGQYDAVKARGLRALLDDIVRMAPVLKSGIGEVKSWDDVKLLSVAINRLKRWTRPGLLCIGDAAHAMSPVGGVGLPPRGRTRRGAQAPRISGAHDPAHAGRDAEQHHQHGAQAGRCAAAGPGGPAIGHGGTVAAGNHRALPWARRSPRACSFADSGQLKRRSASTAYPLDSGCRKTVQPTGADGAGSCRTATQRGKPLRTSCSSSVLRRVAATVRLGSVPEICF